MKKSLTITALFVLISVFLCSCSWEQSSKTPLESDNSSEESSFLFESNHHDQMESSLPFVSLEQRKDATAFRVLTQKIENLPLPEVPSERFEPDLTDILNRQVQGGLVQEKIDGIWRYIGINDEVLEFSYIENFYPDQLPVARAKKSDRDKTAYGIVNANFEEVIPFKYDQIIRARSFDSQNTIDGLFYAKKGDRWEVIDLKNRHLYSFAYLFENTDAQNAFLLEDFQVINFGGTWSVFYRGFVDFPYEHPEIILPVFDGSEFTIHTEDRVSEKKTGYIKLGTFYADSLDVSSGEEELYEAVLATKGNVSVYPVEEEVPEDLKKHLLNYAGPEYDLVGNWQLASFGERKVVSGLFYNTKTKNMRNIITVANEEKTALAQIIHDTESEVFVPWTEKGAPIQSLPEEKTIYYCGYIDEQPFIIFNDFVSKSLTGAFRILFPDC